MKFSAYIATGDLTALANPEFNKDFRTVMVFTRIPERHHRHHDNYTRLNIETVPDRKATITESVFEDFVSTFDIDRKDAEYIAWKNELFN